MNPVEFSLWAESFICNFNGLELNKPILDLDYKIRDVNENPNQKPDNGIDSHDEITQFVNPIWTTKTRDVIFGINKYLPLNCIQWLQLFMAF